MEIVLFEVFLLPENENALVFQCITQTMHYCVHIAKRLQKGLLKRYSEKIFLLVNVSTCSCFLKENFHPPYFSGISFNLMGMHDESYTKSC